MNEKLMYLYCRGRNALRDALWPPEERWVEGQSGLQSAETMLLVAGAAAIAIAIIAILWPAIEGLANRVAGQIEGVPMEWGP